MRKYNGYEIDENKEFVGAAQFVVFGEMADGTRCYHKVVNGVEEENGDWYALHIIDGNRYFLNEGR